MVATASRAGGRKRLQDIPGLGHPEKEMARLDEKALGGGAILQQAVKGSNGRGSLCLWHRDILQQLSWKEDTAHHRPQD